MVLEEEAVRRVRVDLHARVGDESRQQVGVAREDHGVAVAVGHEHGLVDRRDPLEQGVVRLSPGAHRVVLRQPGLPAGRCVAVDRARAEHAAGDLAARRAAEYADLGFTAIKFDPAGPYASFDPRQPSLADLDRCERYVGQIREAVGSRCDLLFGTHGQFTVSGAIRLARRLERFDPLWFEEPTPPESPEEMARVARATSIPIATGERLTTKYEFARVLETGAASILQMNLGRVGGLLEGKKIAGMAECHYAQIAPHLYCGPVVGAANIQLATCTPNFLILEGIGLWDGIHGELLTEPIRWEDGHVLPPTGPGLGVELDESVALAHPYDDTHLHLEAMPGEPPVRRPGA